MGLDINNLLSNFFNNDELNTLNSSGIDINNFTKNFKSVAESGVDSLKLTDNLQKLSSLGVNVKSLSDLEKVKSIDPNKLLTNSIDIKSLQDNLSKFQNSGVDISSFTDQVSKIKTSGISFDKLTNFASNFNLNSLTGKLTQNLNINSLTQSNISNLLGGLTNSISNIFSTNRSNGTQSNNSLVTTSKTNALKILVPSQYLDVYVLSKWGGESALVTTKQSKQMVWYDYSFDRPDFVPSNLISPAKINDDGTGDFGINIHLGYPGGKKVGNWSEDGSQCFSTSDELKDFFGLCEKHLTLNGNKFSYTLATKDDWEQATKNVEANKLTTSTQSATQSTATQSTP